MTKALELLEKQVLVVYADAQKEQNKKLRDFNDAFVKLAQVINQPGWDLETIDYWLEQAQKRFELLGKPQ